MEKRTLGKTPIEVSRLGLGCATFGREIDEECSFRIMDYALKEGITLFDTAESYGGGEARAYRRRIFGIDDVREATGEEHSSEKIIGRWLKNTGCRDQVTLQTKITTRFTRAHVAEAVDASLERLQTDVIDIYLFHSFDARTSLEECLDAMTFVLKAGRVRVAGCSNFTLPQLRKALEISQHLGLTRLEVIQSIYNLVHPEIEGDVLPFCREQHVGVVTYSPLGAGFLSGKYRSDGSAFPKGSRFDVIPDHANDYFSVKSFKLVARLRQKAESYGIPMVQLAMKWVLHNPDITSVLVGARTTAHLDNALKVLKMEVPDECLAEIRSEIG
jgi:aryl-alcohol dehydrogenase-like predicted oxidoreductase